MPPAYASRKHLAMSHARLEVRMESLLPFLQGTCTPYNMPVYPGAQCIIAISGQSLPIFIQVV